MYPLKHIKIKMLVGFLIVLLSSIAAQGQVINGSFENGANPDLSNWEWTCATTSYNDAAPFGGNWCIKVYGGNTQGCFPGFAYQKIPSIANGQTFLLSGWAYSELSPPIGIYFGKINNGIITLQAGDTTHSTSWTLLNVQSSFSLTTGDTAVVVLHGGLAGGPFQGYGFFDLIELQTMTGVNYRTPKPSVQIFPNPFNEETTIQTVNLLQNATLTVVNSCGEVVKQFETINGQRVVLSRENLTRGFYFVWLRQGNKVIAVEKLVLVN